ncbi:hypothetical protein C6P40_002665 [Pichia californica]|uniref:Elongator complex protein 2 n=1 Tax=Pichia californica TaxID=460514 RepID=A0A9P6WHX4_9ASCO|nr:hypothetical protein C6P42_001148 [[Candida] californica]KAG0687206.1 hypothetical protein C6P40_002665 [[Candida] californica]
MTKIESIFAGCNRNLGIFDYNENLKIVAYGSHNTVSISTPVFNSEGYDSSVQVHTTLNNHNGEVTAVKWIQSTNLLLSASQDGVINIWKFNKDKNDKIIIELLQALKPTSGAISSIGLVSNDDKSLNIVVGDSDGLIYFYSFNSEENKFNEISNFKLPYGFYAMALNIIKIKDSEYLLLIGGSKPLIHVVSLQLYTEPIMKLETSLTGHDDWIRSICVRQIKTTMETVDGVTYPKKTYIFATASLDRIIRLWKITIEESCNPVYVETNKLKLLTSKEFKFETQTNRCCIFLDAILMGHDDWVSEVSWKPYTNELKEGEYLNENELTLLSSSADSSIMMWKSDPISGVWFPEVRLGEMAIKGASTATGSSGGFYCSKWIINDTTGTEIVLSNGKTGSFRCWVKDKELENVYNSHTSFTGPIRSITDISWCSNGEYFLATSLDQSTRLYSKWKRDNVEQWYEFGRPQIHGFDMISVKSINATRFVSAGDEKVIRVFDMPKSIANMLGDVCELESFKNGIIDESLPEYASLPVLGLSNKATLDNDIEKEKENKDDGKDDIKEEGIENGSDISNNIMKNMKEPPVEDILQRHTLWPEIEKLYGHGFEITTLDISNDGKIISSACRSNVASHAVIRNFNTDNWLECDETLKGHDLTITRLRFSLPNQETKDEYLLSVSRDRKYTLWKRNEDGFGFELVKLMEKAHSRIIWDCAWVNYKDVIAFVTCSRDKEVKLWVKEGEDVVSKANIKFTGAVTAIDSININNVSGVFKLVIGLDSGEIYVYQVSVSKFEFEELEKIDEKLLPGDSISRISIRPTIDEDGVITVAVGSKDNSLRVLVV